jgi:hypothetical protein
VITGEYEPEPPLTPGEQLLRLTVLARLGLYLLPWACMSGGMILVGALALGPRKGDIGGLWICLPAGLALLTALVGFPLWLWRRSPPWVRRFEYDGELLTVATRPGRPAETRPVGDVAAVSEHYRRRQGLVGYRVTFRDGRSVILSLRVTNAYLLYVMLKQATGHRGERWQKSSN